MTATTITALAAREHVDDLLRQAEHRRRPAELRSPRRVKLSIRHPFARRAPRTAVA
jgi:polyhydroxyalkanoate synthesis regulator phasin